MNLDEERNREEGFPTQEDLALISRFSRRKLMPEEVFAFPVVLCDNEVDRDYDCFPKASLEKLSQLFVGKTGIFDHDPKGQNQTARIYKTEVLTDQSRKTSQGEPYSCLKAYAYMVRTEKNGDLILEIDAGIKKEVSVGCTVGRTVCSICGSDIRETPCKHKKGRRYGAGTGKGALCYHFLEEPADAYEWSFVAVPAQVRAGVTKVHGGFKLEETDGEGLLEAILSGREEELTLKGREAAALREALRKREGEARIGREYLSALQKEAARLNGLVRPELAGELSFRMMQGMLPGELEEMKRALERQLAKNYPYLPQTAPAGEKKTSAGNGVFQI